MPEALPPHPYVETRWMACSTPPTVATNMSLSALTRSGAVPQARAHCAALASARRGVAAAHGTSLHGRGRRDVSLNAAAAR